MRMIKYELWLDGVLTELDRTVQFLFKIPYSYDTYEQAECAERCFYIKPRKTDTGEVVFDVYEEGEIPLGINPPPQEDMVIDTIHWNEWWKYEYQIQREAGSEHSLAELMPDSVEAMGFLAYYPCSTEEDYEPYADKFEIMYEKYLTARTFDQICESRLQCTSYSIRPVVAP